MERGKQYLSLGVWPLLGYQVAVTAPPLASPTLSSLRQFQSTAKLIPAFSLSTGIAATTLGLARDTILP